MRFKFAASATVISACITDLTVLASDFVPGRIYAPADGGVLFELDQSLQLTDMLHIQNTVDTFTGAAFNNDGNLVTLTRLNDRLHFIEVSADGQVLRTYNTGNGTLLRGSQIDYDPEREEYIFANDHEVTLLNRDLQVIGVLDWDFDRAAGVAFGPDELIAATDSSANRIIIFDRTSFAPLRDARPGSIPVGIVWRDGRLYSGLFGDGKLVRVDPATLGTEDVITGLGFGGISDVDVLPTGEFLFTSPGSRIKIHSPDGIPLHEISVGGFADSIALFESAAIPCPGDIDDNGTVSVSDLLVVLASFGTCPSSDACPGDINEDGVINVSDLLIVIAGFGPCPESPVCPGDFDGDGVIDVGDLLMLLVRIGPCPEGRDCPWDLDGDGTVTASDAVMLVHVFGPCA